MNATEARGGSGGTVQVNLKLGTRWRIDGHLHAPAILPAVAMEQLTGWATVSGCAFVPIRYPTMTPRSSSQ